MEVNQLYDLSYMRPIGWQTVYIYITFRAVSQFYSLTLYVQTCFGLQAH